MTTSRFEASEIKNKIKRDEVSRKSKKKKQQDKLQRRLARAKIEVNDPMAKEVCQFKFLLSTRSGSFYDYFLRNAWQKMFQKLWTIPGNMIHHS